VPVQTVVPEPPSPRPLWIAAVASLVLALVIALVGPGAPGRSGTIAARTVAINGSDPAARTVRLDLGQIVDVTGPASVNGHVVDAVTLDVQAAGISLVKRSAPPTVANGTFDASVDLSDGRYLVPGQSTGRLELHSGDTVVASRQFSIVSARSSLLTLPGIASVLLGMLALAWVESVLRNLRRGRRRRTGPWALGLVGGVVGLSIVLIVWGVGGAEPTALTAVVAVVLGISAGVAAALAAVRGARRRRGRIA
jgi:serine/threonine-protein kinase